MKQVNVYYPFLFSTFKRDHSLMLSDLKWKAFETHDFLGDSEDWALLLENMHCIQLLIWSLSFMIMKIY